MNNTITEVKNTLEGINSRITEEEEWMSELDTERWTSLPQNRIKKKERREMRMASETSGRTLNAPTFAL